MVGELKELEEKNLVLEGLAALRNWSRILAVLNSIRIQRNKTAIMLSYAEVNGLASGGLFCYFPSVSLPLTVITSTSYGTGSLHHCAV
ncbi:hypothetical protein OUZ56_007590 [Daphnia magna]|uniref:Uncharacterized protein n=1 Tax=Daphnia magna TaxID=35525 RepID=A0ABR0AAK7_9CRUS|nr:hypothetical protein OUZ56_007590 [Daphnia magna]